MLILLMIAVLVLISAVIASLSAAPWVPVWRKDLKNILDLAQIKSGEKFVDLGCGDGRVLVAAAKNGAWAVGYEINFLPYLIAKLRQWLNPRLNIRVYYKNFWQQDLNQFNIIYAFLMPQVLTKLDIKLKNELSDDARIITYVWPLPNWDIKEKVQADRCPALYLYKKEIPPKRD